MMMRARGNNSPMAGDLGGAKRCGCGVARQLALALCLLLICNPAAAVVNFLSDQEAVWTFQSSLFEGYKDSKQYHKVKEYESDKLSGTTAAAYWVEWDTHRTCPDKDDLSGCYREQRCYVKAFMDSKIKLPYIVDRARGHRARSEDNSVRFLALRPGDLEAEERGVGFRDNAVSAILDGKEASAKVYLYQRDLYEKLPYLTLMVDCAMGKSSSAELVFKDETGAETHRIRFDKAFMEHVRAYHEAKQFPKLSFGKEFKLPPITRRLVKQADGRYKEDANIWAYSEAFAKEFDLPREGIDKELKGAEAVAFRVEWSSLQLCGWFGKVGKCSLRSFCSVDAYVPATVDLMPPPYWQGLAMAGVLRYRPKIFWITRSKPRELFGKMNRKENIYYYEYADGGGRSRYREFGGGRQMGGSFDYYNTISLPGYAILNFDSPCGYREEDLKIGGGGAIEIGNKPAIARDRDKIRKNARIRPKFLQDPNIGSYKGIYLVHGIYTSEDWLQSVVRGMLYEQQYGLRPQIKRYFETQKEEQ